MFGWFKSRNERPALSWPPTVGDGRRVYAIGDIHGRYDLLLALMEKIGSDDWQRGRRNETKIIFLGDYVDRGPQSRQVIDFILRLREKWPDMQCLMGNHEQVFQMAINGDESAVKFLLRPGVGGRETLMSYGLSERRLDLMDSKALTEWIVTGVPEAHKAFIASLDQRIVVEDYAFVHAGIAPGVPLAEQETADLYWIRDGFLDHEEPHPYMVIHGHTVTPQVDARPNRIGIDTGAYETGKLTAIGLEGTEQWFLSTAD
jgi:serine/threonine protein phosphatase 1